MSIRETVYGIRPMEKKALWGGLLPTAGDTLNTVGSIGAIGAAYLLAGAMITGAGAGFIGAKVTAKGKQDEETAKKSYENERLKADIGYLSGRLREEYANSKSGDSVKPAVVMR